MLTPPLALALSTFLAVQEAPAGADPLARFGWLRDLAGHCWSGTYGDGKTSDTQCYKTQWGHFLRGTITLTGAHQGQAVSDFKGDSVFAWSRKKERIVYTNWSSDGGYGGGEAFFVGAALVFPEPRKEGQPETRTRWTRLGPDAFQVVREQRQGEGWKELLKVVYRRVEA
jgi:hypothetical protein